MATWRGAVAEDREELAERGLDQDKAGDVGQATADPVADRRREAQIVAEARLGVGVDAGIELGLAPRQRLEDEGQHQHAQAGNGPGDQGAQGTGRPSERRGDGKDARADHRTHDEGDERAQGEFLFCRRGHTGILWAATCCMIDPASPNRAVRPKTGARMETRH
jgi:hypothetical protein